VVEQWSDGVMGFLAWNKTPILHYSNTPFPKEIFVIDTPRCSGIIFAGWILISVGA
jgi:hypothetical protein